MNNNYLVGITLNEKGVLSPFSKKYAEILDYNKISWIELNINETDYWQKINTCTHIIYQWGGAPGINQSAMSIMPVIDLYLKKPCYPNFKTTWQQDDKIKQYYLLHAMDFPIIKSWIFWNKNEALNWIKNEAKFPLVFKLKAGAGSKDVLLINKPHLARKIIKKSFSRGISPGHVPGNRKLKFLDFNFKSEIDLIIKKTYRFIKGRDINPLWQKEKNVVFFQKFMPNNEFDTRVTIIGNRAYAFRRFNRPNDFRSSGSGIVDFNPNEIDIKFIKLAFEISHKMGFQSMAYDFLWDEEKPVFCEISYNYSDIHLYKCPGHWDQELKWNNGNFWPQLFILQDLLNIRELNQPPFEQMEKHKIRKVFK